jgi:hypothetical protein
MAGPGLTIGTSAGAIIFVGTIVALWVVAQFVSRRSDRANKTNPKLRRAEQKALSLSCVSDHLKTYIFERLPTVRCRLRALRGSGIAGNGSIHRL